MKKLLPKNRTRCNFINQIELKLNISKAIQKDSRIFMLIRRNAFSSIGEVKDKRLFSRATLSLRCLATISRKRFNSLTFYSRHVFLKQARNGSISGLRKAVW